MNTPVLNDNLRSATEALCNLLAKEDKVVASKAKIGLFVQNPEATKLFEEVNAYGEELRNKHLAGMPPTEEEISKFDALRENVIKNDAARGFLEARQTIDELLNTINHYLGMSIDLGRAPTPEEIEEARQRAMSAQSSCSCGGQCDKENCDCDGFTQKVKPFFLSENKRYCPARLQFPPENRADYCTSLLSAIFSTLRCLHSTGILHLPFFARTGKMLEWDGNPC